MNINIKSVFASGIVAGIIIMIVGTRLVPIVGDQMNKVLESRSLSPLINGAMTYFAIISFILGISIIGVYALGQSKFKSKIKAIKVMNLKVKLLIIFMLATAFVFGQNNSTTDSLSSLKEEHVINYRHSVGASVFMLFNLLPEPADYYLFTYGYQLTQKDRVFVEFNTWKYSEPLGTYGHSKELYPGFVRAFGVGAGYQRFHWKGLFTTIEATPFIKQYYDINDNKTQRGFQLYLQIVAGYRFEFFKKRWYVEPAYALKYWPVDTNFPADFEEIEKGAPKYIFEPSLNFGFKF